MSGKELLEGLSDIDPRFIAEADQDRFPARRIPFRIPAYIAACAAMLVMVFATGAMQRAICMDCILQPANESASMEHNTAAPGNEETPISETMAEDASCMVLLVHLRSDKEIIGTVVECSGSGEKWSGMTVRMDTLTGQIQALEPESGTLESANEQEKGYTVGMTQYVTVQLLEDEDGALTGKVIEAPEEGE